MRTYAIFTFWAGVAWLGYLYAGYPAVLALLGLVRRVRPAVRNDYLPKVSVLIAARNEEKDIGWKVRETLAWDYPTDKLEVLVASDASEDRTDEMVRNINDWRAKLIRIEKRGGKGRALNHLAQQATGDLLFFTDANAHIGRQCLRQVVRHFADSRVGCVTGDSYTVQDADNPAIAAGASVYWGYETLIKYLENRIGSVLVCDGAIFCIRHDLYTPLSPELANDLELPMRIGRAGYWILHEPAAQVFERDTSSPAQEFSRRRRICAQGALATWKLREALSGVRGWQFFSHKVLRWLSLIPMLLILFATALLAGNPWFLLLLAAQIAFYLSAGTALLLCLRGRKAARLLSVPFYVVLGVIGALVGVLDACRGRQFDIWEIPTLSRGAARDQSWQKAGA